MPDIESALERAEQSAETAAEHELVVVESFLGHVKGEVIAEADKVRELLESEWQQHVVKRLKS